MIKNTFCRRGQKRVDSLTFGVLYRDKRVNLWRAHCSRSTHSGVSARAGVKTAMWQMYPWWRNNIDSGRDREGGERERERERERDRERQRETETETERQRQTETETETERQRETERDRERQRDRQTDRQTDSMGYRTWTGNVRACVRACVRARVRVCVSALWTQRVSGFGSVISYWYTLCFCFSSLCCHFCFSCNFDLFLWGSDGTNLEVLRNNLMFLCVGVVRKHLLPSGCYHRVVVCIVYMDYAFSAFSHTARCRLRCLVEWE